MSFTTTGEVKWTATARSTRSTIKVEAHAMPKKTYICLFEVFYFLVTACAGSCKNSRQLGK